VNKQTSSLPLRLYVYSAVVVVSAQLPHDGLLVLLKSQLGTLELQPQHRDRRPGRILKPRSSLLSTTESERGEGFP